MNCENHCKRSPGLLGRISRTNVYLARRHNHFHSKFESRCRHSENHTNMITPYIAHQIKQSAHQNVNPRNERRMRPFPRRILNECKGGRAFSEVSPPAMEKWIELHLALKARL